MNAALLIILAAVAFALIVGISASRGKNMKLEQWSLGGRNFKAAFVFVLMAGEIYTTFTFLGASGYAYGHGAPSYYILCYFPLAYTLSYWLLPAVWRYAKQQRLMSQPDFFARKYDSPTLGLLVAAVGIVAMIPYLVLQLKGLGIIMATASYGEISPTVAVWIGAAVISLYVITSGIHGSAWTAVVKDVMIFGVVAFLGIYLPVHFFGSFSEMFLAIDKAKPGFLNLSAKGQSIAWFDSTVLLTALGFYMWPHTFTSIYTSRDERSFRRNAVFSPLYGLLLLFVMFVGFAASLKVPGLTGSNIDLSLFRLSIQTFDPWFVGVIGATGVLTALVPGSMILMAASTMLANNFYRMARRSASEAEISVAAKVLVPVVALVAIYFTLNGGNTIVALLLMGYAFVTQLFPPLVASFLRQNFITKHGAFAGIVVGVATVAATTITGITFGGLFPGLPQAVQDLNIGIVALGLNVVTMLVVSFVTRGQKSWQGQAEASRP
jgi:solute:Na+ symporter, SSS family